MTGVASCHREEASGAAIGLELMVEGESSGGELSGEQQGGGGLLLGGKRRGTGGKMGRGLCEGGSEESVVRVLARCRPGEGVTGWAEEARPAGESPAANGASSMRGRRGVGRDDWRGGSRGVTVPGAVKHCPRGLGRRTAGS